MSRTQELQRAGAVRRGEPANGEASTLDPTPFVKWQDEHAWVEGEVKDLWSGHYGENVTLTVTSHSTGLVGKAKDVEVEVAPKTDVNVGLNASTLKDTVSEEDKGKHLHIAFEGWREPAKPGGNRYRLFTVLEIPSGQTNAGPPAQPEKDLDKLPF
jgi:hypothetical protein|tara:strand:+ start:1768 stop:2235 length:468 start_codon:yes stop_codon:yes gene_type:complete